MSDCHAGKGCVVGLTAKVKDKIVPNIVGVDISCSVTASLLKGVKKDDIDFEKLDTIIRERIPSGSSFRRGCHESVPQPLFDDIKMVCKEIDDMKSYPRHILSLGSLGGGNHFISVEVDEKDNCWLLVHCGSRNFGHKIWQYHQKKAEENCRNKIIDLKKNVVNIPEKERQAYLKSLKDLKFNKDFAYLEGEDLKQYIKHVEVAKEFALYNHQIIVHEIKEGMNWTSNDCILTNHNYIEELLDGFYMIRKGSVSAYCGQRFIVPLNMRDGSLICEGLGNDEWNNSAPHGAGRVMSRSQAKKEVNFEEFKDSMKNVWSSSVKLSTIDEAPMVYKNHKDIIDSLSPVAEILHYLTPIYNFKDN